jgi:uncharacterized protein (TIGR02594 family)
MIEPAWLVEARKHIGLREVPGVKSHPTIVKWWKDIKRGGIKDDATPWCAAFVGACLENVGIISSRFESARSYLKWGQPLKIGALGCIVVLGRGGSFGHVGFLVGVNAKGWPLLLGGNQGDAVSIAAFDPARVLGYRWPLAVPLPADQGLPQLAGVAPSTSEA